MAHMPSVSGEIRMPISPSFCTSMSMWSARAPARVISPPATPSAARKVAASMRSGTTVCSTGDRSLDAFDGDGGAAGPEHAGRPCG